MQFLKKTLIFVVLLSNIFFSFGPTTLLAKGGLVPCDGVVEETAPDGTTTLKDDCNFATILGKGSAATGDDRGMIKKAFDMIILFVLPLTALWCVYIGFLYLTSGGNTETHTKAKKIALNVLAGLVLVICAWLIVATILRAFGVKDVFNLLKT